jgi:hypothetical protein
MAASTSSSPKLCAESTSLFQNLGGGFFTDRTAVAGLTTATPFVLGFGLTPFDADNAGHPDLALANDHVIDFRPAIPDAEPPQLLEEKIQVPWEQVLDDGAEGGSIAC